MKLLSACIAIVGFALAAIAFGSVWYHLAPDKKYTWRDYIDRKIASDYGPEAVADFEKCAFKPFRLPLKETKPG